MDSWKCMECESETSFKGLCRDCTEYDSEGKIITPVPRVKVNSLGLPILKKKGSNNTNLNKGFRVARKIDVHKTLREDIHSLTTDDLDIIDLAES